MANADLARIINSNEV